MQEIALTQANVVGLDVTGDRELLMDTTPGGLSSIGSDTSPLAVGQAIAELTPRNTHQFMQQSTNRLASTYIAYCPHR